MSAAYPCNIPYLKELRGTRFLKKRISKEQGIETKEFNPDSLKLLEDYEWSGNIRELRNVVERLIILGGNPISKDDVNLFTSKK